MDTILRLRELMNSRGWSEYRLAKESKLSMSTISNIFHRGSIPSIPTLETLCNTFGISLGQFFSKGVSFKWSKQKFVCGKIMVKRKITAKLAVIFLKNGGPNRDRTDDLTDANELKTLICIDFQTFPALSAGMQMALWPLFPVVTMCPGSVCGTRCGHRKTGGKASILGAPIIARNRKSVNGFLNPWRRKPWDAIIKE